MQWKAMKLLVVNYGWYKYSGVFRKRYSTTNPLILLPQIGKMNYFFALLVIVSLHPINVIHILINTIRFLEKQFNPYPAKPNFNL